MSTVPDEWITAEAVEREVLRGTESGGRVVYWHQQLSSFMFFKEEDNKTHQQELKCLGIDILKGMIINVSHGKTLKVESTRLFPMEVDYYGIQCSQYMLLGHDTDGDTNEEDIELLPYLYLTKKDRNNAV